MKPKIDNCGALVIKNICRILIAMCIPLLRFFISTQEKNASHVAQHLLLARALQKTYLQHILAISMFKLQYAS